MNAKKKNHPFHSQFVEAVEQTLRASGGTTNEFNVRQDAASMGHLFAALADKMDAIYGPNSFALTAELRDWSQAFISGDCDGKIAIGDQDGMLKADLMMCWHAVACALSIGADVQQASADFIEKMRNESGT